jgi:hypothetical protein
MPFEVMKWRNYFFGDIISGTNLRKTNCLHSAIPVNYTSEFPNLCEVTKYLVKLYFIFLSLSKEFLG